MRLEAETMARPEEEAKVRVGKSRQISAAVGDNKSAMRAAHEGRRTKSGAKATIILVIYNSGYHEITKDLVHII
jgi:hypothetical protein